MTLTGPQAKQIQDVLLAAFDRAELAQMVQFQLGETIDQIAGGGDLSEIVFNLVQWADRNGRLLDLIDGALATNPDNPQLQELQQEAGSWHLEPPEEGEPPYQGLQYFDVGDADRFFGRERLTVQLVGYLRDHRFLAVIGASGSGKSSVVRAGVVPALASGKELADGVLPPKNSTEWKTMIFTPASRPLNALASTLNELLNPGQSKADHLIETKKLEKALKGGDLQLQDVVQSLVDEGTYPHVLLVVDQFEELFTLYRNHDQCKDPNGRKVPDARKVFVDNLLAAAQPDGPTTVIITLRADFYHHCAEFENLRMALANGQTYSDGKSWIETMSEDEFREAIEKPAALGDWDFEPGLVDVMLNDVEHEPGALPLLSHALLETWNNRRGHTMTFAGYHKAGGVKGAIATRADTEFNDLDADEQAVARNIFVRLTELGEGSADTRRRVSRQQLLGTGKDAETVTKVLTTLGYARLITVDQDEVEVAHEALIREWPTLRAWLEDDREGLRTHRRLTEMATAWDDAGRKADDLDRGTRLEQTAAWAEMNEGALNDLERVFLDAGTEQVSAERREKERVAQEREEARERELKAAQALALEAAARQAAEEERATEAEAREQAETQRAVEAEARLAAEEKSRNDAQAREQAETERAEESEESAHRLRRRSSWLAVALVAALIAIVATGYFFSEARDSAELADERSRQFADAKSTADANLVLANEQLASLEGERLLGEAYALQEDLEVQTAVDTYKKAMTADSDLSKRIGVSNFITDTLRIAATGLVQEGERLAEAKDHAGAHAQFKAAFDLTGLFADEGYAVPPEAPLYVWIDAEDEFEMGSTPEQIAEWSARGYDITDEMSHTVSLDGYWIMRTEVTNAQYKRCVDADECEEPESLFWDNAQAADKPVVYVDWEQANAYAKWVGGRLPTEAEWEMACRSTDGRIYPWADDVPPDATRLNYYNNVGSTSDVGSYPPGANDLYDMAGNVYEWTADWYGSEYYANSPDHNPQGEKNGSFRTLRGGSWLDYELNVRCAYRADSGPDVRLFNVGFRVVSPGF